MTFVKGDILLPVKKVPKSQWLTGLFHAAVLWDDQYYQVGDFQGIMLTHTKKNGNILMSAEHFESNHEFRYENTHFANKLLNKFESWGPFNLAGKLTPAGIDFIDRRLDGSDSVSFEEYRNSVL